MMNVINVDADLATYVAVSKLPKGNEKDSCKDGVKLLTEEYLLTRLTSISF